MLYQCSSQVIKVQYGAVTEEVVSYHEQDVCPDKDQVENLAQVTTKVLPSTLTMDGGMPGTLVPYPGKPYQKSASTPRKYSKKCRDPMFPEVSQDSLKVDVVVATLYLGVLCNQGISLIELHSYRNYGML